MSIKTISSQSVTLAELDVSGYSLPYGFRTAAKAPESYRESRDRGPRQCRDLVTTHVYTVPPQEGTCVRLYTPERPVTGPPDFPGCQGACRRARSTNSVWSSSTANRKTGTPRRYPTPKALISRRAKIAEVARELHPTGGADGGPGTTSFAGISTNGIHRRVDEECQHPRRALHTAPALTEWWASQPAVVTIAAFMQADSVKRWDGGDPRPPTTKACLLRTPARGLASRCTVDWGCKKVMSLSEVSRGARQFLEQWDRSSRAKRGRVLVALTDNLLLGHVRSGSVPTWWPNLVPVGSPENNANIEKLDRENQREKPATSKVVKPSNRLNIQPLPSENKWDQLPSYHNVSARGANHAETPAVSADTATNRKRTAKVDAIKGMPPGLLELLGPHVGLLATRISSHLEVSHACGYDVGPCLCVANLLAEATATTAERGRDGHDGISSSLVRYLSTPRAIQIVLDIITAEDSVPEGCDSTAPFPEERDFSRTLAFRLLLAIARARGRHVKESLTCSLSLEDTFDWGEAIDSTMIALRKRACSIATQTMAGSLLVELGLESPVTSAQVWNAILCLLEQDQGFDQQTLGCHVAADLLAKSIPRPGDDGINITSGSSLTQGRMRPELVVIPSVLRLALSTCSRVREAAGDLAAVLTTQKGPCCYLLASGIVGLLGRISGVDRGAPSNWIPRTLSTSGRWMLPLLDDGVPESRARLTYLDAEDLRFMGDDIGVSGRWADNAESGVTRVGRTRPLADENETRRPIGDSFSSCYDGRVKIGLGAAQKRDEVLREGHAYVQPHSTDEYDLDQSVHALELLRRICAGNGQGCMVREALESTRAPLAILDLIVASASRAAESSLHMGEEELTSLPRSGDRKTFVTQISAPYEAYGGEQTLRQAVDTQGNRNSRLPFANSSWRELHAAYNIPQQSAKPVLPRRYCRAVAETLLAIYRRSGDVRLETHADEETSPDAWQGAVPIKLGIDPTFDSRRSPTDSKDVDLKDIINAAMVGCPNILRSISSGDSAGLTEVFFGHGSTGYRSDGVGEHEEITMLRKNVLSLTVRLGHVRPAPTVTALLPTDGEVQRKHFPGNIGDGYAACAPEIATCVGSRRHRNIVDGNNRADLADISGDGWSQKTATRSVRSSKNGELPFLTGNVEDVIVAGRRRPASIQRVSTAEGSRAAFSCGAQQPAKEPLHTVLLRARGRPSTASPSFVHGKRWRRHPHITTVIKGTRTTVRGLSEEEKVEGPRVWGPEDWGKDAPTMAMLTELTARKQTLPARPEGESSGPVWKTLFEGRGGTELGASFEGCTAHRRHRVGKSKTSDAEGQGLPGPPHRSGVIATSTERHLSAVHVNNEAGTNKESMCSSLAASPQTHILEVSATHKVDAAIVGAGEGVKNTSPLPPEEKKQKMPPSAKWTPPRPGSTNRPKAWVAKPKTPLKRWLGGGGNSRDHRNHGASGSLGQSGRKNRSVFSKVEQPYLKQYAQDGSSHISRIRSGKCCIEHCGLGSYQMTGAQSPSSVIKGSQISRCDFEMAERYLVRYSNRRG